MSDGGNFGGSELALGGVLGVMLLGGLFFLYRSLAVDPVETAPVAPPVVEATPRPGAPAVRAAVPDEPTEPPAVNSGGVRAIGASGGASGGSGSGGAGPGSKMLPTQAAGNAPWFVSGSVPGGRPIGSGGSPGRGGAMGGGQGGQDGQQPTSGSGFFGN